MQNAIAWTLIVASGLLAGGCTSGTGSSSSAGGGGAESAGVVAGVGDRQAAEDLIDQAEARLAQGDKAAALAQLARAIEINPKATRAHMNLGDIHRLDGDYARAESNYRQAAQSEPSNFDAQFYHGLMLHALDRVREAIGAYLRALSIKPDDFLTTLNLASAYYQVSEARQALAFAEKAVRLNPQDGAARFTLGAVYADLDQHAKAVVEFQQAAELMELSPALLLSLGKSLGRLERWDEMRNALAQCVARPGGATAEAYERLGFAQFKSGRNEEAKAAFARALEINPQYFPALNGVGVCELNAWIKSDRNDQGAHDRGVAALRASIKINRDQPRILELLARYP